MISAGMPIYLDATKVMVGVYFDVAGESMMCSETTQEFKDAIKSSAPLCSKLGMMVFSEQYSVTDWAIAHNYLTSLLAAVSVLMHSSHKGQSNEESAKQLISNGGQVIDAVSKTEARNLVKFTEQTEAIFGKASPNIGTDSADATVRSDDESETQ